MSEQYTPTTDELRKIAEEATPGPWYTDDYWGVSTSPVQHEAEWTIVDTEGCGTSRPWDHDFIAAFNPETVLALLDRVEEAEQAIARVRAVHEKEPVNSNYGGTRNICLECERSWPCLTIRALDGAPEPETAGASVKSVDTSPERDKKSDDSLHVERLAARDAGVAAKAWDEGALAQECWITNPNYEVEENPYRKAVQS